MHEALPPDFPGGVAAALGVLRHALADPLSAAGLKLELLERRLSTMPASGSALLDRVRATKSDLAAAGRLIDLLPRLAAIAGELPTETSISDFCRVAGFPIDEGEGPAPRFLARRLASIDALRIVVWFLRSLDPGTTPPRVSVESTRGQVRLRIETNGASTDANLERISLLPRGQERGEELFLARACIESDGGGLQIAEEEGRVVALLSWPQATPAAGTGVRA